MATATVSSFSKALALGEIHEDLVIPYPLPDQDEAAKVRGLIRAWRMYADEHIDPYEIDRKGWIEDQVFRGATGSGADSGRASPPAGPERRARQTARLLGLWATTEPRLLRPVETIGKPRATASTLSARSTSTGPTWSRWT